MDPLNDKNAIDMALEAIGAVNPSLLCQKYQNEQPTQQLSSTIIGLDPLIHNYEMEQILQKTQQINPSLISPATKLGVLKNILPELSEPVTQPKILEAVQKANPMLLDKAEEPDLLSTVDLVLSELKRDPAKYPIGQFMTAIRQHNPNLIISVNKPKCE